MRISVLIPTYQAARHLPRLLSGLWNQTLPPSEIVIVDSSSSDGSADIARDNGCRVEVIPKALFNHGGTRNLAASLAQGDVLTFMTQDALPADHRFLEELTRPVMEHRAVAAYSRQLPYPDASPPETFARQFNYPAVSHLRTQQDIPTMGIKAFFFSNVASCVRADAFRNVGGFPESVILNEDMLLCATLLRAGGAIAYQAGAKVFHSHSYGLAQHFQRYFDIGVAVTQAGDLLDGANAGGEGLRFATEQVRYLVKHEAWRWVPRTMVETGLKYIAYQLGKRERFLSHSLKRRLSMHGFYWDRPSIDS